MTILRHLWLLVAAFFFGFAALQFNDHDFLQWALAYGSVGFGAIATWRGQYIQPIAKLGAAFSLLGSVYLWPAQYRGLGGPMLESVPEIELARESLGLLLATGAWLAMARKKL
ncbi:MAG: transmembrane 220 family protein [Myxococcota bacterium]|nr:transmembrane 220 family protein [Myxococcota bacterium]